MDVQWRDALEELGVKTLGQIFEPFSLPGVCPSLPHHSKLDDHIGGSKDVLGQGNGNRALALVWAPGAIPVMVPLRMRAPMEKVWIQSPNTQARERWS